MYSILDVFQTVFVMEAKTIQLGHIV